ncbi:MAG TPA: hypothetical protein VLF71_04300 [Candidatus Saccharimonadales bacterium]|nr:hypothetical protein [Candidatus Saccharimonadales bacterium]
MGVARAHLVAGHGGDGVNRVAGDRGAVGHELHAVVGGALAIDDYGSNCGNTQTSGG